LKRSQGLLEALAGLLGAGDTTPRPRRLGPHGRAQSASSCRAGF
jgi:hypothetical protein